MIAYPNCKINIGLRILRKRLDNYHDIETVFYPVPLCDVLEILPSKKPEVSFANTGLQVGSNEENLCVKAYRIIKNDFPDLPGVNIHLHKVIPAGAGLGGGSSNAAAALELINTIFLLEIPAAKLNEYSLVLGSDCPFFLLNKPALATGRGEILEPIELSLSGYTVVMVFPNIHCSTAKAFSSVVPFQHEISLSELCRLPVSEWKNNIVNNFEQSVFKEHPSIQKIKEVLYLAGADYASLSGSGSSVFGLFKKDIPHLDFPEGYTLFTHPLTLI